MLNDFGGPTQYLKHELGGSPNEKWSDFAASLQAAFPRRPDQDYIITDGVLPRNGSHFKMPLWALGWVGKIIPEILHSSGTNEPLFWTHYVQGAARASAAAF